FDTSREPTVNTPQLEIYWSSNYIKLANVTRLWILTRNEGKTIQANERYSPPSLSMSLEYGCGQLLLADIDRSMPSPIILFKYF
ncbi:MAG: hypothetical protein QW456_04105, partial [Ignisphaera sp.]